MGAKVDLNCGDSIVATAPFNSGRAIVVGRAASTTGQSSIVVADIETPAGVDSCEGQCAWLDAAAGARQVASHHARAGAAAPIRTASRTRATRCTTDQV